MNQILYSGKMKKHFEFNISHKTIIIIAIIVFAVLLFILSTIFAFINRDNTNILSRVTVNNVNLSNLSKEEGLTILKEQLNETTMPDSIDVIVGENTYTLNSSELIISYDYNATIENAYNVGRSNNLFVNNYVILKTALLGTNVLPVCNIDDTSFDKLVEELTSLLEIENLATDTTYEIFDDLISITKGTPGSALDKDLLKENIIYAYASNDYTSIYTVIIDNKIKNKLDSYNIEYKIIDDNYF